MTKKDDRWIFATAGLGNANYLEAANRLASQVEKFGLFSKIIILDEVNLPFHCPSIYEKYSEFLNPETRGYGFMSWKAEFIFRLLERNQEMGLIWADCGCEASVNYLTKFKLERQLYRTQRDGYLAFTLDTQEREYTKKYLYSYFPTLEVNDTSPQFQTTYLGLAGMKGIQIAQKWFHIVGKNLRTVNEEISDEESEGFAAHRHDQSVFSLVMKEMGIQANLQTLRNGRGSTFKQLIAQRTQPILAARNRSGVSILI